MFYGATVRWQPQEGVVDKAGRRAGSSFVLVVAVRLLQEYRSLNLLRHAGDLQGSPILPRAEGQQEQSMKMNAYTERIHLRK